MAEVANAGEPAGEAGGAAAAAATPPPAAARLPEPPYDEETMGKITAFFQKRKKNAEGFTYTATGDLEVKEGARVGKRGKVQPAGTINLKRFVPLEPAEREALEEMRLETLADLEEKYETEMSTLRAAWAEYAAGGSMREVLAANQRVAELDARRNAVRSAVRNITWLDNPVTRTVLLDQPYEERKMFNPNKDLFDAELYRVMYYPMPQEQELGKYVVDEEVAEAAVRAGGAAEGAQEDVLWRKTLKDGRKARVFFEPDSEVNGFLSPMAPVEFILDELRYAFALQAYEALRADELGKADLKAQILKTRQPRTVRLLTRKETAHPSDARGLWTKILTAVYQQHPPLKEKLLATGTDSLVYADAREGPSGIGLAETDSGAVDPAKWKGENIVGTVLESIRTRMREETLEEAPTGPAKGGAITEEEVEKARVGAIINARRFGGGRH